MVLMMDANDVVRDGAISVALADIGIKEVVISRYWDESVPATYSKNKHRKSIGNMWNSPGLDVLHCGILSVHNEYRFDSDHCLVWAESCNQSFYCHCPQQIFQAHVSKVKSSQTINQIMNNI